MERKVKVLELLINKQENLKTIMLVENGILVGKIVNINAEERILTDGKIDPKKLKPIAYDPVNNTYIGMGNIVEQAFQAGLQLKK